MSMEFRFLARLINEKLHDRTTYILAAVVGSLINGYGQLLVPWFRSNLNPFEVFLTELSTRPGWTILSVFLAFAFPFCVGIYSAVASRYKNRRMESLARFPEQKPDPVFRAKKDGRFVEVGANTQKFFSRFKVDSAQGILGEDIWARIISGEELGNNFVIDFYAEGNKYVVVHALTRDEEINVYMTRISGLQLDG